MKTFAEMARQFRSFSVEKEGETVMQQTEEEIAGYNRSQLRAGYAANGERLRKYRSRAYATRKNQMNPAAGYGNPDYKLTGSYHEHLKAAVASGKLKLYSTDPDQVKVEHLEQRDGGADRGLTEESKKEYRAKTLYPGIARRLSAATGARIG